MLAWTLNTSAANGSSTGRNVPSSIARGRADGASSRRVSSSSPMPKFHAAEPNSSGMQRAARERLGVEPAPDLVDELELLLGDGPRLGVGRIGLVARRHDVLQRHRAAAGHARELVEGLVAPVDHAAEAARDADRPGERRERQPERLGQVVDHPERLHARAVVLVHERDQRDPAGARDLEELLGLGLDAAGRVDQDHGGVDRGQHPQRVLGEVLVPGRVEQVEDDVLVLEAQHRGRDRDAAAALEVHPVRRRRPLAAAGGDRAGLPDRAGVEQQLLGEGGLARVRVRDDRERAAARRLLHHASRCRRRQVPQNVR